MTVAILKLGFGQSLRGQMLVLQTATYLSKATIGENSSSKCCRQTPPGIQLWQSRLYLVYGRCQLHWYFRN